MVEESMAASSSNSSGGGGGGGGGGNGNRRVMSVVEDQGVYSSNCGYCKTRRRSSVSYGLFARRLTVDDYQELLDRGWRRSGMLLYKPECSTTCCPPYTIRLEADKFVASKEQRRVMRRMNRYLEGGETTQSPPLHKVDANPLADDVSSGISLSLKEAVRIWIEETGLLNLQVPDMTVRRVSEKLKKQLTEAGGGEVAQYTSNAAFLVASAMKRMQVQGGLSPADIALVLAAKLSDRRLVRNGQVKACKGHINFYLEDKAVTVQSTSCMEASVVEVSSNGYGQQHRRRSLELRMQRSSFDAEEFELYKRYQIAVHNDRPEEVRENSYRRFLVESPLVPVQSGSVSYGSFHQQYRIDGRLVAVGVVDILPKCLSSKYLFWDPDFAFLSLGKYSALQEIEWVQSTHQLSSALQYYYLGYYIHSCPKMRYKAAYFPSELLCPQNLRWMPFDVVRPLVETGASVCISDAAHADEVMKDSFQEDEVMKDSFQEEGNTSNQHKVEVAGAASKLGNVPILLNSSTCILMKDFEALALRATGPQFLSEIRRSLFQYWQLVGSQLASRMAYVLQPHRS